MVYSEAPVMVCFMGHTMNSEIYRATVTGAPKAAVPRCAQVSVQCFSVLFNCWKLKAWLRKPGLGLRPCRHSIFVVDPL